MPPDSAVTTTTTVDLLRAYAPLISLVGVMAGWVITHKLTTNREIRKALREHITQAQKRVDELEKTAIDYHTRAQPDRLLELSVIDSLTWLEQDFEDLAIMAGCDLTGPVRRAAELFAKPTQSLVNLRKTITAAHFQDDWDAPLQAKDLQISDIRNAITQIKLQLRRLHTNCLG